MHILDQFSKPVIFAHRGSSASAPENTFAAFDLAFQNKSHAIELDTMLSLDGVPVVIHDRSVKRTTNGEGYVDRLSVGQLEDLDAGSWFSEDFSGERIPLLKKVLERYGKKHLINIELKNYHAINDNLIRIVIEIIEVLGIEKNVLLSSFIPRNLRIIQKINPKMRMALLCSSGFVGKYCQSRVFSHLSPQYIHPMYKNVSKSTIKTNHKNNRKVHTWTVNEERIALDLAKMGIDGIITNCPGKMFELVHSQ